MISEFPTRNFIFVRSYLCEKQIESYDFILSILQFIYQDLTILLEAAIEEGFTKMFLKI